MKKTMTGILGLAAVLGAACGNPPAPTPGFPDTALDTYEITVAPNPAVFSQLMSRPDDRFVMVNMLVYKEAAEGEGFEGLSGAEAYGRYASGVTTAQNAIGSRMIWVGAVERQVVGTSDPRFATVALLEYASPSAFLGFARSGGDAPEARSAGLRGQWLVASTSLDEEAPSTATASPGVLPPTEELVATTGLSAPQLDRLLDGPTDAPVFIVELLRFADGSGDAYRPYRDTLEAAGTAVGRSLVWRGAFDFQVLGAAAPSFHEMVVTRYPNRAAYLRVLGDEGVIAASQARVAGLAGHWIYTASETESPLNW